MTAVRVWAVPTAAHREEATNGPMHFTPTAALTFPLEGRMVDPDEVTGLAEQLAPYGARLVVGPPDASYSETVGAERAGMAGLERPRRLPRPTNPSSPADWTVDLRGPHDPLPVSLHARRQEGAR